MAPGGVGMSMRIRERGRAGSLDEGSSVRPLLVGRGEITSRGLAVTDPARLQSWSHLAPQSSTNQDTTADEVSDVLR
jgi:hypothetical protein